METKDSLMKKKVLDEYELALKSGRFLQREAYGELIEWKKGEARNHVACILRGARRVGKTVLALQLAHERYRSFVKISFDRAPANIKDFFINGLDDLDAFYDQLMVAYDVALYPGESLLILDDVQFWKPARQAIKALVQDGRYDILETGSLAAFDKSDGEEEHLLSDKEMVIDIHPLSFREFLLNDHQDAILRLIESSLSSRKPLGAAYETINRKFREYLVVGGMPRPMRTYLLTHDLSKIEEKKRSILALYRNDAFAQKKVNSSFALSILSLIPTELSHRDSRFRASHISQNARLRDYAAPMKWLEDAGIITLAYPVEEPFSLPKPSVRQDEFKAYLLDTGLLYSLTYLSVKQDEPFYKRLLSDSPFINGGMFAKNYVAQALSFARGEVCYYVKRDERSYKTTLKADFLMLEGGKATPIEIKSPDDHSRASLNKFKKTFQEVANQGILLHDGDISEKNGIRYFPLFMLEWL